MVSTMREEAGIDEAGLEAEVADVVGGATDDDELSLFEQMALTAALRLDDDDPEGAPKMPTPRCVSPCVGDLTNEKLLTTFESEVEDDACCCR